MSFDAASWHIANLAGVDASSSSLQRWSLALGEEALRFEREEVVAGKPLEPRMCLSIDGTGIPMRKEDVEGVAGKQDAGRSGCGSSVPAPAGRRGAPTPCSRSRAAS